jgi:hypothetical protein
MIEHYLVARPEMANTNSQDKTKKKRVRVCWRELLQVLLWFNNLLPN